MFLISYHIVMSFVLISCVKKKKNVGTSCGCGWGWGLFSDPEHVIFFVTDLPYIVVNSVVYKVLWGILYLYELDLSLCLF